MPTAKPISKKSKSVTRAKPLHKVYTTPLPKKLGIAANMQVAILAAPDGFEETLGELPPDTTLATRITPSTGLALCFAARLTILPPPPTCSRFACPNKPTSG